MANTETPPKMQILQSTTPAMTKKMLAAAEAARQQAAQQTEMMKQLMTMFQPGGQMPGSGSIGSMMQPQQQAGGAAGATFGHPDEGMTNQNRPQDNMQQTPKAPPKQRTA